MQPSPNYSSLTGLVCVSVYAGGESQTKKSSGGRKVSPYNTVMRRKKDKSHVAQREEKTASIRSYPKRLSPTVLSDEFYYANITGRSPPIDVL